MIDTSVMVAGLVANHEFHDLARPHVRQAGTSTVPGIVLAETWAALRRGPWHLGADVVERALEPWADPARIAVTPAAAYQHVLRSGRAVNLGGNVHDLLIALTCASAGLPLTTLDRRQAALAAAIPDLEVSLLVPAA